MSPYHSNSSDAGASDGTDISPNVTTAHTPDRADSSSSGSPSGSPIVKFIKRKLSFNPGLGLSLGSRKSSRNLREREVIEGADSPPPTPSVDSDYLASLSVEHDSKGTATTEEFEQKSDAMLSPAIVFPERSSTETVRPVPADSEDPTQSVVPTEFDLSTGATGIKWEGQWLEKLRELESAVPLYEKFSWERRYIQQASMFHREAETVLDDSFKAATTETALGEIQTLCPKLFETDSEAAVQATKDGLALEAYVYGRALSATERAHETMGPRLQQPKTLQQSAITFLASMDGRLTEDPLAKSGLEARGTVLDFLFPSYDLSCKLYGEFKASLSSARTSSVDASD